MTRIAREFSGLKATVDVAPLQMTNHDCLLVYSPASGPGGGRIPGSIPSSWSVLPSRTAPLYLSRTRSKIGSGTAKYPPGLGRPSRVGALDRQISCLSLRGQQQLQPKAPVTPQTVGGINCGFFRFVNATEYADSLRRTGASRPYHITETSVRKHGATISLPS